MWKLKHKSKCAIKVFSFPQCTCDYDLTLHNSCFPPPVVCVETVATLSSIAHSRSAQAGHPPGLSLSPTLNIV